MAAVGFTLQPRAEDLELLAPLILEDADYYEVAPETLWRGPELEPNDFHRRFEELRRATGRPFVAHGVGWSPGSVTDDEARRRLWVDRIARTHAAFEFEWYTDHLGASTLGGQAAILPMPLPMTDDIADLVRGRMARLQEIVPRVGLENSVFYYTLGDPLEEPGFLARCLGGEGMHGLLDLHNLYTMSVNLGFDPAAWLARYPLERVIEIHVSGGSHSNPQWLPDGASVRLDSHDAAVPEEVWALLAEVAPRCPALLGVTLERMEGTVRPEDVDGLRAEMARARELAG